MLESVRRLDGIRAGTRPDRGRWHHWLTD